MPVAEVGLPLTHEFGSSADRAPGDPRIAMAFDWWWNYFDTLPSDHCAIYTDGSFHKETGATGGGAAWYRGHKLTQTRSYPISLMGSSPLAELSAKLFTLEELVRDEYHDFIVYLFTDSAYVFLMFTTMSEPKDNVDLVDRVRSCMQILFNRNVRIVLSWIPGHVGIPGNEKADQMANMGAEEALQTHNHHPQSSMLHINNNVGISYRVARSQILQAADRATQEHWDSLRTNLKKYKSKIQKYTPYIDVGTPFEIRMRTSMRLGNDCLNFATNRFNPKRSPSSKCPFCPRADETANHFLCMCPEYKEIRIKLREIFREVHPEGSDRVFNSVGLLREPIGNLETKVHLSVIHAVNQYITDAYEQRKWGIHLKEIWDD